MTIALTGVETPGCDRVDGVGRDAHETKSRMARGVLAGANTVRGRRSALRTWARSGRRERFGLLFAWADGKTNRLPSSRTASSRATRWSIRQAGCRSARTRVADLVIQPELPPSPRPEVLALPTHQGCGASVRRALARQPARWRERWRSILGGHDGDGAIRCAYQCVADRVEQEACHFAVSTGADDNKLSPCRLVEQRTHGRPPAAWQGRGTSLPSLRAARPAPPRPRRPQSASRPRRFRPRPVGDNPARVTGPAPSSKPTR